MGAENIYIFGLTAEEVAAATSYYNPWEYYGRSPVARRVMDALGNDRFCPESPGLFRPIRDAILGHGDHYFHLADLDSYVAAQERVSRDYQQPALWARKAILNVARTGKFSSDRTVKEYAKEIWGLKAVAR